MLYLERLILPNEDDEYDIARARRMENGGYIDNGYPCMLFTEKELRELSFEPITLLCGGNGSGKSTLLNVIALKLGLKRLSPYNSSELMDAYAARCRVYYAEDDYGDEQTVPPDSRMVTSDDVFEYMLAARTRNEEVREETEIGKGKYAILKHGTNLRFTGMDSYEDYRLQVLSRQKSLTRRKFLQKQIGVEARLCSNGETALDFFESYIQNDTLYCLDEPENSLSPKMQLALAGLLDEKRRYCGCQFIIATHSPFVLSISSARIYDLDASPVDIKRWWELDNTRTYFDFFYKNKGLFGE